MLLYAQLLIVVLLFVLPTYTKEKINDKWVENPGAASYNNTNNKKEKRIKPSIYLSHAEQNISPVHKLSSVIAHCVSK